MVEAERALSARERLTLGLIALWLAFQILFPLRHLLYAGSPSWTEQGHRFAWQMKLRDKAAVSTFLVRDPASGREWVVFPEQHLLPHQADAMEGRPDMILQFAHHLARSWERQAGIPGVEVRAYVCASLNGRRPGLLIDPDRDLVKVERSLRHADWVLPLEQPFERPQPRNGPDVIRC